MLFKNILLTSAVALASIASAVPTVIQERGTMVTVTTDNETATIEALDSSVVTADLTSTKRQVTLAADALVISIIDKVQTIIQNMIDSDVNRRQSFTQQVVGSAVIQFPGKNIAMSNVGYTFTGSTITTQRAVYDAKVGSNVDFFPPHVLVGPYRGKNEQPMTSWFSTLDILSRLMEMVDSRTGATASAPVARPAVEERSSNARCPATDTWEQLVI
ncbi:hypothetical protein BDZ45DRAFT_696413 [Acephala macrosclerotiorum]|nr:hypothetical protein BDZ45DRAFT_696413 [Acephala macrosclerotiorum]